MEHDGIMLFLLQISPFIILLAFSFLSNWSTMWFDGVVDDYTADSVERITRVIMNSPSDDQINEIRQNESAQNIIKQVAVTTGDKVYLPLIIISLTISGSALMFVELLKYPTDVTISVYYMTSPPFHHIVGVFVYIYTCLLWLFAIITVIIFRDIHPGRYFEQVYISQNQINADLKSRFLSATGNWLVPLLYTATLLIIIMIYLTRRAIK
jgi:hypothetical protein